LLKTKEKQTKNKQIKNYYNIFDYYHSNLFENVTQEKSLTLATAAVCLRRPSAT